MAKVGVALGAHNFGANHPMATIRFFGNFFFGNGFGEAGPAASSVKFRIGLEQDLTATDTTIKARRGGFFVLAGKWRLGRLFAGYRRIE